MPERIGFDAATSKGTNISCGANDTKPGFVTLGTASVDFKAIELIFHDQQTNFDRHMLDVGVAGVAVTENLFVRGRNAIHSGSILIPRGGSSGQAVQINGQTDSGSNRWLNLSAVLLEADDLPFTPSGVSSTYGDSGSATTQGTVLDPGGVINTEVKTEITTSGGLDEATDFLSFCVSSGGDATLGTKSWTIKVYTGATGADDAEIGMTFNAIFTLDVSYPMFYSFFVDRTVFAAGTRVWLGVQCTNADASNRLLEATMQGYQIDQPSSGGILGSGSMDGGFN